MNNQNLPALITEREAAEMVGIAYRTWRRWSRSGLAPAPVKIGQGVRPAIRFRKDELLEWVEAGCPEMNIKEVESWKQ